MRDTEQPKDYAEPDGYPGDVFHHDELEDDDMRFDRTVRRVACVLAIAGGIFVGIALAIEIGERLWG